MVTQAASLDLVDTEYSACSIAACPEDRSVVACGLYQIQKDASAPSNDESPATKRVGRCLIYTLDDDGKFNELQRFETAAILDMAWSHEAGRRRLAIANSVGQIDILEANDREFRKSTSIEVAATDRLVLSLDWDNRKTRSAGAIVASISDGNISILRGHDLQVAENWHAHDFEPWIAIWDYWETQIVWTGGDDCKLKKWDLRQGYGHPVFVQKDFGAGVTTAQSHPLTEHLLAVGSYDEKVRVFDVRQPKTAVSTTEVGGGVWRLRWHPSKPEQLLAACMHDGFKVLNVDATTSQSDIVIRFDAHGKDALAYGVDWCQSKGGTEDLIASCSFYDHQLRSWRA